MIFYFGTSNDFDFEIAEKYNGALLASYHYFKTNSTKRWVVDSLRNGKIKGMFIDSGAFSALHSGAEVKIDDYCKYLLEMERVVEKTGYKIPLYYAGLDVIGDPKKTWENQKYMEREYALAPIPTYHLTDNDFKWLHKMVEEYDYIAIGGVVGNSKLVVEAFFDQCWSIIMDKKPDIKTHGFGLSTFYFMDKYPWTSADSTSYKGVIRFGYFKLFDPEFRKIESVYIEDHLTKLYGSDFIKDWTKARIEAVRLQFLEYKKLEEFITERHAKKDFSYLKRQLFG